MEEATRLIAVRHGETAWNVDTRIQGQLDIGLNATGVWQAQRAGGALADEPIGVVYASDLARAWPCNPSRACASALSAPSKA
jgi:probable phosphoglycerate mutase